MRISDWSSDVCSSDLSGRTDHARQLFARNAELSVARSAGRHHDRVVKVEQLGHRHRTADIAIADETDIVRQRGGFIAPRQRLDCLMIRGPPCPNQPYRGRQPLEDVHAYYVAELFLQYLGGVIRGRAGPNTSTAPTPQQLPFKQNPTP